MRDHRGSRVADHHALRERGMPDGFGLADGIGPAGYLAAIARARGSEPGEMPVPAADEHFLVNLGTGLARTQHMAITRDHGVDAGWTRWDEIDRLDLLDALRDAHGLGPCDRERLGGGPGDDAPAAPGF